MERSPMVNVAEAFPLSSCLSVSPTESHHRTSWEASMSGGGAGLGAGSSYQNFVYFALEQTPLRTTLTPSRELNPLYDTTVHKEYKEKYRRSLMHLVQKYSEPLPWGGKITSESLRFFSPIVSLTIFEPTECNHQVLHSALTDYYKVWLELMDQAVKENGKAKNCS